MNKWTDRFALQLIKDNGHLESFLVDLSGYSETGAVVTSLRANGCTVEVDLRKSRLLITPVLVTSV